MSRLDLVMVGDRTCPLVPLRAATTRFLSSTVLPRSLGLLPSCYGGRYG